MPIRIPSGGTSDPRFRLGILGRPDNRFVLDLKRAAREIDIEANVLDFSALRSSLLPSAGINQPVSSPTRFGTRDSQRLELSASDKLNGNEFDENYSAILVRSMPLGSLEQVIFRMDVLHAWQSQGCAIINSPRCLETSIDKWLTLQRLHEFGVRVPPTVACQNRNQAMEAFDLLQEDVLVKPLFGGEGRGIIRLQNRDLAWRTFSTLQQIGQVLYLQQYVPNLGYDIRVLIIGDDLWSIKRWVKHGEFRSNISQGGMAELHRLTPEHRELAVRCARAVGGGIVGVDLLPAQNGEVYALEVNAVPGWSALATCLNLDVSSQVIRYAMRVSRDKQYSTDSLSAGVT